ncbi:MAG: chemotaxis protein CheW [Phormidesmis sp.]
MNNPPNSISSQPSKWKRLNEPADSAAEVTQYITFKLADYLLALPTQQILKIVATPSPEAGGLVEIGLVQLGQHSIQVLDLFKLLGLKETAKAAIQNPPFLVVFQNSLQDLWGIALLEPPDLMSVPDYALKPVPPEKRLTRMLRWVSHVVTYDLNSSRHTLLLLDLPAILHISRTSDQSAATANSPAAAGPNPPVEASSEAVRKSEMYA